MHPERNLRASLPMFARNGHAGRMANFLSRIDNTIRTTPVPHTRRTGRL